MRLKQRIKKMLEIAKLSQSMWAGFTKCITIARLAWVLSSFQLATFAYAGEASNFNQQIEQLKTAKRVAVILSQTPDSIIGNTKDGARDALVRLDACHYFVTDQSEIKDLIANFKQLNIKKIAQEKSFLPYESIAIRFDFANGKQTQMLIGFPYPKESTVDGEMYFNGQSAPQTFVINRMIHRDIRRWLVKHGKIGEPTFCPHKGYCEHVKSFCNDRIKNDFFRSPRRAYPLAVRRMKESIQ